jgi:hypothetical protein
MSEKIILVESRLEDFNKNYAKKFSQEQRDRIIDEIPSKFWPWVGKELDQISFGPNFEIVKNLLDYFNKFGSNLAKSDIFQYKNIGELQSELDAYANRQRRNYKKIHGANVVYESPKYLVVNPLSFESSCYYGKGTKWCTSGRDSSETFNRYNKDGKLFYILDKTLPSSDPNYKIGISRKFSGDESFYDSQDKTINTKNSDINQNPELKNILEKITAYINVEFKGQVDAENEKKRKKEEETRLRNLEIQRRKNQQKSEADERRVEQIWAQTPDIDEEGKMAWAVLNYLENELGNVRDRVQDERLLEIQTELDRLNAEYEADPEFREDIYDQINDLEEERDEILEMLDVYYIIPKEYKHHGLAEFEVIHDDFYGQSYAVGTEDEVQEAMEDYVESLIDDIGITGFNESFWKQHLDTDAIESQARDMYSYDVEENPDSYLNEEDRLLDSSQIEQIKIFKDKIDKVKSHVDYLQEIMDMTDDEDESENIQSKIDELEENITEMEEEIESIESDPQGDWPEELKEDKIEELVHYAARYPENYLEEQGLSAEDFVDREEFIQAVIDEDGYGQLSPYDGSYEIFGVMGERYYVFRID